MNNRLRAKIRWTIIALLFGCGVFWWLALEREGQGALFLTHGALQLAFEIRRGMPIRLPLRRKSIVIDKLRYPNG